VCAAGLAVSFHADQQHVVLAARVGASQHIDPCDSLQRGHRLDHGALGKPHRGRPVGHGHRLGQLLAQGHGIAGGGHPNTGHDAEHRQIPVLVASLYASAFATRTPSCAVD
jgi:hypothetical protein